MHFKSEEEAIEFVRKHTPFAVLPTRKSKYQLVYPFRSFDAEQQVIDCLAKALIKRQENHP